MSTRLLSVLSVGILAGAVAACGWLDRTDFGDVVGAGMHPGCKEPCVDTGMLYWNECMDTSDPAIDTAISTTWCDYHGLMTNEFHIVKCQPTGEGDDCALSSMGSQAAEGWWRRLTCYGLLDPLCSTGGTAEYIFQDCQGCQTTSGSEGSGIHNPCWADSAIRGSRISTFMFYPRIVCRPKST